MLVPYYLLASIVIDGFLADGYRYIGIGYEGKCRVDGLYGYSEVIGHLPLHAVRQLNFLLLSESHVVSSIFFCYNLGYADNVFYICCP